jgi:hypothetical protein
VAEVKRTEDGAPFVKFPVIGLPSMSLRMTSAWNGKRIGFSGSSQFAYT